MAWLCVAPRRLDGLVVRGPRTTRWLGRAWRKDDFPARSLVVRLGRMLEAENKDFCETKLLCDWEL
ncbi:hypothetical protein DPMN_081075 [Dreissena polymorpha]|uniref:Uncharacterized protein n=1 Tax=Dreissena polymorpha TaxID=45954 RepID=A0A9D4B8W4_DREPO|nr:hypothetical protein DPMN_081075 [Dreissena polymorpha]